MEAIWASANNPLWILRSSGDLEIIKGDKQPVVHYENMTSFSNHEINLQ